MIERNVGNIVEFNSQIVRMNLNNNLFPRIVP
jgi:hypothetical protein